MKNVDLSIILPTFNEAGNIIKLIRIIIAICKKNSIHYEIIVVDDNSPDRTGFLTKKIYATNKQLFTIIRKTSPSLAKSIFTGIKHSHGKYVLVMDTDFNHNPKEIRTMYQLAKKYSLVIGSRYIKNGGMENRIRQWLSYCFNLYIRVLLGYDIHDNLSGFFITNRKALTRQDSTNIFYGFGEYFIRLIHAFYIRKMTIIETPVFYKNRSYGQSKSKFFNMFITYTYTVLKLHFS